MSEYKEALAWVECKMKEIEVYHEEEHDPRFRKDYELDKYTTIRKALRLADKVTGDPSEGMIEATITSFNDNGKLALVSHAKAYINQAIKELEE